MNNQFATQYLLEDIDVYDSLRKVLRELGAAEDNIEMLVNAVKIGALKAPQAIEIVKKTKNISEDGAAGAPAGGGGTTNGASWSSGTNSGEQYAAGTRKKKHQEGISEKIENDLEEDAPRLAGNPAKTNRKGSKNLKAYSSVGFTKAPTTQEEGLNEDFKSGQKVEIVKGSYKGKRAVVIKHASLLPGDAYLIRFEEGGTVEIPGENLELSSNPELSESRAYSRFKKETAIRSRDQQMHEAVKTIHKKLEEVSKLLEYAQQMRTELSEGEQTLEYNHSTKKIFERINSKVVEVYSKTRQLK